jgi:hypothetical protein
VRRTEVRHSCNHQIFAEGRCLHLEVHFVVQQDRKVKVCRQCGRVCRPKSLYMCGDDGLVQLARFGVLTDLALQSRKPGVRLERVRVRRAKRLGLR